MPEKQLKEKRPRILFADDELSLQELMRNELPRLGYEPAICPDGRTAIAALEKDVFDCLLVDLDMPDLGGLDVIARCKELSPETEAIVLTGKSSLDTAVAALRHGACDYLTKPCRLTEIDRVLKRALQKRELANQCRVLQRQVAQATGETRLIGDATGMRRVRLLIEKVAPSEAAVLIRGETGTGKELVARAIYEQSARAAGPYVTVNCGALPESLIESELFGHRKGAFTGADDHRTGLFQMADGGTLFLDEIGELPKAMQAKLLRVLETGEIRRVGDDQVAKVDVRIVAATHRDLDAMAAAGDFREDLLFRINTFEIHIPPLRERPGDLPLLAEHLASRFAGRQGASAEITAATLEELAAHAWPGNVRELANVIEHALILSDGEAIAPEHLPHRFAQRRGGAAENLGELPSVNLRELEMLAIHAALDRHDGSKPAAAQELGVSLKTLYNKLNQEAAERKSA